MANLPGLIELTKETELLSEVLAQLEKDLGDSHQELVSLRNSNVEQVVETIADFLWELYSRSQQNLFNLFYRIDLPEDKVQELLRSDGFEWNALAELILKRELQKVILRRRFSK